MKSLSLSLSLSLSASLARRRCIVWAALSIPSGGRSTNSEVWPALGAGVIRSKWCCVCCSPGVIVVRGSKHVPGRMTCGHSLYYVGLLLLAHDLSICCVDMPHCTSHLALFSMHTWRIAVLMRACKHRIQWTLRMKYMHLRHMTCLLTLSV